MTDKKKTSDSKNDDRQAYAGVAIVFFVVGIAMVVSDSTRTVGLPFIVLGITFFILSQDKPTKKRKK